MKRAAPPMAWIPASKRTAALILLAAVSVSLLAVIMVLDRPLRTPAAPDGIVSFEFSGSAENARRIIDSWSADARRAAAMSLGLDYLFLIAYAAAIALACGMVGTALETRGSRLGTWGHGIAWAQWVAAACDMVENLILLLLLGGFRQAGSLKQRSDLPALIPTIKAAGGTDIVVTELSQIVI